MMRTVVAMLSLVMLVACGSGASDGDQVEVQSYTVNGVIAQLPSGPGGELMIAHEAIPDFVNSAGEKVGMGAMTMGFPPGENVTLDGFAMGDSIQFRFEVRWGGSPPLQLVSLQKRQ